MRNALIAILIIFAGISANFGLVGPGGAMAARSETTGAGAAPAPGRPAAETQPSEDGPLKLICEEDGAKQCSDKKLLKDSNAKSLIAMVPDPERTHLALTFDRDLESIVQAAQDRGYTFSRSWLPWRGETVAENNDPKTRKQTREEKPGRGSQPGLLLFRGDKDLLAVFLVGETPTSGVDRQQFFTASGYIGEPNQPGVISHFLGILGPYFSGSFDSLKAAIGKSMSGWNPAVVSGSTTSKKAVEDFQMYLPTFRTTVRDDESAYCLLRGEFPGWERVALLSEDGTGYGAGFEKAPCASTLALTPPKVIYYPREISLLRDAYQEDPALAAAQNTEDPAARRQLLLPLRDSQGGRDTLPQFSGAQTPASQETVLFQISEILKRERSQAAIIRATNVLDTLFLSRFLRQCCADLRVAVLDSDLLFIHGTDSLDYLGVITVGSGPLRVEEKQDGAQKNYDRVFASSDADGIYHAAKSLLKRAPADPPPPLWISVVGRGMDLPVKGEDGGAADETPLDLDAGYPSRLWDAVFYTCSLLALLYVGVFMYALGKRTAYVKGRKITLPRWCADFHPSPELPNYGRAIYHLLTTVFLFGAYLALAFAPAYLFFARHADAWRASAAWAIAVAALLLGMAMWTAWKYIHWLVGTWLVGIVAALAAIGWSVLRRPEALHSRLFRAERSAALLSGVAPSLPVALLLLALAYWAWVNMQRFIFVEERNTGGLALRSFTDRALKRIKRALNRPVFVGSWWRAGGIIAAVVLSWLMGSFWIGTLEPRWFDGLFLTLLTGVAGLLLLTAWAYFRVWRRLRRGLQALDLHPIRFAFAALPSVTTWSPLWQPTARTRSYSLPERMAETTRMLEARAPSYYSNLSQDLRLMQDELKPLAETFGRGLRESAYAARGVNVIQNRVAENLANALENSAWGNGSSETLKKIQEGQPRQIPPANALPDLLAAEVVAIRQVAFIRYVMLHLKNQLSFMTVGFILLAISLNCYSFQGEGYFRWWLTGIFLILSSTGILVFMEMSHDATLSNLTDTSAGKLDPGFYFKALSAGALPLLAVVSSQFPDIGRFLFSWLQPALSALH